MGKKRQISQAEEFQIIYIDSLPLKRNITLTSYMWAVHSDFFPKSTACKGEKCINFIMERPDNHYLSRMIKVNIKSGKSC